MCALSECLPVINRISCFAPNYKPVDRTCYAVCVSVRMIGFSMCVNVLTVWTKVLPAVLKVLDSACTAPASLHVAKCVSYKQYRTTGWCVCNIRSTSKPGITLKCNRFYVAVYHYLTRNMILNTNQLIITQFTSKETVTAC